VHGPYGLIEGDLVGLCRRRLRFPWFVGYKMDLEFYSSTKIG
jgi:hypothetical protein